MIGDKLKTLRMSKDLKQADVASHLNISRSTYTQYETGASEPSIDTINQLANFFDVSPGYLIDHAQSAHLKTPRKKGIKIPVLGEVQAGIPVEAIEDIIDYEEITEDMARTGEFFGLQVRGQSMGVC